MWTQKILTLGNCTQPDKFFIIVNICATKTFAILHLAVYLQDKISCRNSPSCTTWVIAFPVHYYIKFYHFLLSLAWTCANSSILAVSHEGNFIVDADKISVTSKTLFYKIIKRILLKHDTQIWSVSALTYCTYMAIKKNMQSMVKTCIFGFHVNQTKV